MLKQRDLKIQQINSIMKEIVRFREETGQDKLLFADAIINLAVNIIVEYNVQKGDTKFAELVLENIDQRTEARLSQAYGGLRLGVS